MADTLEREAARKAREAEMKARSRARVLDAAVSLAQERGLLQVTRLLVAERSGLSVGTVNYAYGNMGGLREAVIQEAVTRELPDIVAQGLALGSETARNAPPELKHAAASTLT